MQNAAKATIKAKSRTVITVQLYRGASANKNPARFPAGFAAFGLAFFAGIDKIGAMSKLFQIHEDDLAELERTLPQFSDALMLNLTSRLRTQLRRCQTILSNVRWNYGPPTDVEIIESEGTDPSV